MSLPLPIGLPTNSTRPRACALFYWRRVKQYYDGYGRLIRVTEPHPEGGDKEDVHTDYVYDPVARTVTITPPAPRLAVTLSIPDADLQISKLQIGPQTIVSKETIVNGKAQNVVEVNNRKVYENEAVLDSNSPSAGEQLSLIHI